MEVNIDAISANIDLVGLATGNYIMKVTVDEQTRNYKITRNNL